MPADVSALFVLGIVAFIGIIILAIRYEAAQKEKRRLELAGLAERLGFQFFQDGLGVAPSQGFWADLFSSELGPNEKLMAQFEGFEPFGQGHSRTIRGLLAGTQEEIEWVLFDYEYKITRSTGKTTTTTTYHPSIAAARLPMYLPWLRLGEESFFTRLGERLGIHDIHFESDEFNHRYRVHCQDRKAAFDLLHPQTIEYLLSLPIRDWQMGGFYILLYTHGRANPMEFLRMMEDIKGLVELVPEYMRQDREVKHPGGPLEGIVE